MAVGKMELIAHVANATKLTKADSQRTLEAVLAGIKSFLKKGETVRMIGFGTFVVRKAAARNGRNPRTGEKIKIKACKRLSFRAGTDLKKTINKS